MRLKIDSSINITRLKKEYPVLWETLEYELPHLSNSDKATIVEIIVNVCPHCYEEIYHCNCWNEE